jgi:hypothetical protein
LNGVGSSAQYLNELIYGRAKIKKESLGEARKATTAPQVQQQVAKDDSIYIMVVRPGVDSPYSSFSYENWSVKDTHKIKEQGYKYYKK